MCGGVPDYIIKLFLKAGSTYQLFFYILYTEKHVMEEFQLLKMVV